MIPNQKKNQMTRRELLSLTGKGMGLALVSSPLQILMSSLVEGIVKKAQANVGNTLPRNYLLFHTQGGPPRFVFDQALNPYSADSGIISNLGNCTNFLAPVNGAPSVAGPMTYQTANLNVAGQMIRMPWMWGPGSNLPVWSGGDSGAVSGGVPMSALLTNYLCLRGVNNFSATHFSGAAEKLRPSAGFASLNGLVADASSKPVPAVGVGSNGGGSDFTAFSSATGVGQAYTDGNVTNPTANLLSSFNNSADVLPAQYLTRRKAFEQMINSSLSLLGSQAQSRSPGSEALYTVRNSAVQMLNQGVTSFIEQYPAKLAKYRALIGSCADYVNYPIPGITDLPILPANYTTAQRNMGTDTVVNADLRTILSGYRQQFGPPVVANLAESFAVAEILLMNNLSSTLVSQINYATNLYFELAAGGVQPLYSPWGFDEHASGTLPSLIVNSWVYRSQMACLYELSRQLQTQGLWEETVVEFVGDFPRTANLATYTDPNANPQAIDASGTGHASQASVFSIFSGAIQQPLVLGNIYTDSYAAGGAIPGTWGLSAPVTIAGASVNVLNGNVASTVADLLRVQSVTANNASLIAVNSSGTISPTVEKARNI